jgi:hypothetical protein
MSTRSFPRKPLFVGETLTAVFYAATETSSAGEVRIVSANPAPGDAPLDPVALTRSPDLTCWFLAFSTSSLAPGLYGLTAWETIAGNRRVIAAHNFTLLSPDAPGDLRSVAAKCVAVIEAYMAGNMAFKKISIADSIGGGARALEHYTPAELLPLLAYWRNRLADEEASAAGSPRGDILYRI